MGKKISYCLFTFLLLITVCHATIAFAEAIPQVKISVFNFGTLNLDASGYGTSVTNMLINSLSSEHSLALLDRKELEAFLNLNDLQQNDDLDNVFNIGSKLGLNVIVVGSVEKKGSIISINCKVINIEQKKTILNTRLRSFGDAGLMNEVRNLGSLIIQTISKLDTPPPPIGKPQGPENVRKQSGNKRVNLNWDEPSGMKAPGYEVFRSNAESGPFAKIAQVDRPEYRDQDVERNTKYCYRIRAFNGGLQSDFSSVICAETALTPSPPVILRAEGHVKSIQLTCSPSPVASDDPLKLKGYKLYRAKTAQGPFKEVANVLGTDLGIGLDTAAAIDKLLKVNFLDKGLADGEDYYYRLTAYNEKNLESDFSAPIKGTAIPVVDTLIVQGDLIREIGLSWIPLETPFIKGYYIFRSTSENGNFTKIKKIDSPASSEKKLSYSDKEGLGDKVRYYYRITAFEEPDIETSPSMASSAVTKGKPPIPQGLKAQSGLVKKVEITWMASPQEEVEGYILYWSKEKVGKYTQLKKIENRSVNNFVHGGAGFEKLEDNTTYYYTMTSYNRVDLESDLADTASATTKPRPTKPSGLKGESLKVKEAPLSWLPNAEKDIGIYHIYRSNDPKDEFSKVAKVQGKNAYVDKDLKDGATYYYKIQAEDKDELQSDFSDSVSVRTKPKPQRPEGLADEFRGGKVELSWKSGNVPDIDHYIVYEKRFFGLEKIDIVKKAGFSETGPAKGKNKIYVVTSVDKDGLESEPSEEVTVTGK